MLTEKLACDLTPEEIRLRGKEAARLTRAIAKIEIKAKHKASEYKEEIKRLRKQHERLTEEIHTEQEYRDVQIEERKDWTAQRVETIRLDTDEVINTRPMTPQELQRPIPFEQPGKAAEKTA